MAGIPVAGDGIEWLIAVASYARAGRVASGSMGRTFAAIAIEEEEHIEHAMGILRAERARDQGRHEPEYNAPRVPERAVLPRSVAPDLAIGRVRDGRGERFNLSATVVDTNLHNGSDVNDEGQFKGNTRDRGDNVELAAGAAGGGLIGGLAGGGKGFLVGAAIGAGATTIHWLTKHHSAILPAGTELVVELSRPMEMSAAVSNGE